MNFPLCRSALLLSLCSLSCLNINAKVHYRFQSGNSYQDLRHSEKGDSYGTSLHYDSENGLVYVTGGTYSSDDGNKLDTSNCFLTLLKVPEDGNKRVDASADKEMKMVYETKFGFDGVAQGCSAVMDMPSVSANARAITMGNTEEGGSLTNLRSPGSRKAIMYGFIMDFDIALAKKNGSVVGASGEANGGRLLYDSPVQYPMAMTSDPLATQAKDMYIALLSSPRPLGSFRQRSVNPLLHLMDDKTDSKEDFRVVIEMIESKSQATLDYESAGVEEGVFRETLASGWKRSFSPNTPSSLHISDLVYVPRMSDGLNDDVLVLTGTTNGYGSEFGGAFPGTTDYNNGFVTKLNPTNGDTDLSKYGSVATTRIGATNAATAIHGVCFSKSSVDTEYIYVVGHTDGLLDKSSMQDYQLSVTKDGKNSKHAFVAKLRLRDLSLVWSRQIGSQDGEDIIGHGCDVTPDDSAVYLAGTVTNGGSIRIIDDVESDTTSTGGDDIFVASYSTTGGDAVFIKQFGTTEDDTLAGGKSVVCDEKGNAFVLGNTRGSMMRLRAGHIETGYHNYPSDVFVMSIGKEKGKTPYIAEIFPSKYSSGSSGLDQPIDSSMDETSSDSFNYSKLDPEIYTVEAVAIAISCLTLVATLVLVGCSRWKQVKRGEVETDSTNIVYSNENTIH